MRLESVQPAAEELNTGRFSSTGHPAWRPEDQVVGERDGEAINVMRIEGVRVLLESLAHESVPASVARLRPPVRSGGPYPAVPPCRRPCLQRCQHDRAGCRRCALC